MEEDFGVATLYSKVKVPADETYASLRLCLEDKAALEWPFEFWDNDDQIRVPQRMESFSDMPGHVYVLPLRAADEDRSSKRQRVDDADAGINALPEDGNCVDIREESKCRAPLLEECPQHHGHKGDPEVTPGTCGAIGERAQVILVWVRAPGRWERLPPTETRSHEG